MAITKATASSIAPAAKGDLVAGSATNDAAVLGVGANNTVLTADSAEATGLKWVAASAPTKDWAQIATASLSSGTSYQFTGLSGYEQLMFVWKNVSMGSSAGYITITLNSTTTGDKYQFYGVVNNISAGSATTGYTKEEDSSGSNYLYTAYGYNASDLFSGSLMLQGCNTTARKVGTLIAGVTNSVNNFMYTAGVIADISTVISTLEIRGDQAFDAGTVTIFGSTK